MTKSQLHKLFAYYLPFRTIGRIGWISKKSIPIQSLFITLFFAIVIILASIFDKTLILDSNNRGLLEHPTIWTFLILQGLIPFALIKSINKLLSFFQKNDVIVDEKDLNYYLQIFKKQLSKQSNFSKVTFTFFVTIGFLCFIWNSFQNQMPYKFLGFDYWDSIYHPFGYWVTRVYKFYLWVIFFPSILHIHSSVLYTLNMLLKDACKENFLVLKPYHQDGYGGVGDLIKIAINPCIPILFVSFLSVCSVFWIHRALNMTPVIGLLLLSLLFILVYIIPALTLRRVIKKEKKRQLNGITESQNIFFLQLIDTKKEYLQVSNALEALNGLTPVYAHIKSISTLPYLSLIVKVIGVINLPILVSLIKSIYPILFKK